MLQYRGWGSRIFDASNYIVLLLISLAAVIPFIFIFAGSFTSNEELIARSIVLIPAKPSLDAYKYIFSTNTIVSSLMVTIFITLSGTLINLVFTSLMAYALSRKNLDFRNAILSMVIFSMLFNGGMVPTFLVVRSLGLYNSFWALLLPGAISAFNLIVMKNFFQQVPEELQEAAKIDGCNDLVIFLRIVLPLSLPAMATFALFYCVGHWNTFFNAIMYLNNPKMWPIQVWLRQIVILSQGGFTETSQGDTLIPPSQSIKMAVIIVTTIPILIVYPFLQKHFAKGVMVGSIKG